MTDDLQRLGKVDIHQDVLAGGKGDPLTAFASDYTVLFECLEAIFGTMMSNSRLCEQIHRIMRHGL